MEKYEGNLYDFLNKYDRNDSIKIAVLQSLFILELCLVFIHDKCNVCLNEIKLENILYKQKDRYVFEFVFTDIGNSSITGDEICKQGDRDRFRRQINQFRQDLDKK